MQKRIMTAGMVLAVAGLAVGLHAAAPQKIALQAQRTSPQDLEITGDLSGIPAGQSRFVRYADLATLHQVSFTVKDDPNFAGPVQLGGVPLDELIVALGLTGSQQLVAADGADGYEGHYTSEYRTLHHPFLVLTVGGKPPAQWPRGPDGEILIPYVISQPFFKPAFRILAHIEEPQLAYAVTKLRFYDQVATLAALKPPASAGPSAVQGYRIMLNSCLRCHSAGDIGGNKSPFGWPQLALIAKGNADAFGKYVIQPNRVNPEATMPPNPNYDAATVAALVAYFQAENK
ncbi:MAG TPA: cytochrome c [Acidobacteriaceae bacterium]|jgi:mono/diheme cytochrome c family protein|nr:cytochrome c [Acidobacteriaceae bacterium]